LTKAIMLYAVPLFVIILFLGRDLSPLLLAAKYAMLLAVMILIKNTNPRLRIDQVLRFFWGFPAGIAALAVILAMFGL
ncbi:MAG: NADH-quinone oxidoreductase subunit H, partial [Candidatus Omnitrophota bacterium]